MEQSTIAIIIFALAFISFVWEKIPMALTCILGAMAMAFSGILDFPQVYSGFGGETVVMVAGMMIIGLAFDEVGVTRLLGRAIARIGLHRHERLFVFGLFLLTAGISAFFSNVGTTAMIIPLVQAMSKAPGSNITQRNSLMPVGMAAGIGGGLTLIGTTPQLIVSNLLATSGIQGTRAITFWETGYAMLPLVLVAAVYFLTIGYDIERKTLGDRPRNPLDDPTHQALAGAGAPPKAPSTSWKTYFSIAVMIAVVFAFMFGLWDVAIIALGGAAILVMAGCLSWKKALQGVDWNTIVILGTSAALAAGLNQSGGGLVIAYFFVNLFGGPGADKYLMLVVLICVCVVLTNFMGNAALVAAMVPIGLEVAGLVDADPMGYSITITVACLLAVATPIGTASVTQTLVGGYHFKDYVQLGLPITVIMTVVLCAIAPIVYTI